MKKYYEYKDRFLFIGERLLNTIVTISYMGCILGIVYVAGSNIFISFKEGTTLPTYVFVICALLFVAFLLLKKFSKYLERKHFEFKELVFGMDLLKGDLYRMGQNSKDPNYVPVPLKRGSPAPVEELNTLIGLETVKEKVEKLNALYEYEKSLSGKAKEKSKQINRHYAFIGNPGTGKTTVARIFAGLLYKSGRIKRNVYVECTGNDIISEFSGDTKNRIAKIYNKARNGVLFIDEAYVLAQSEERASEALAQLLTYMENDPTTVVIFAGYKKEMEEFIAMNSGLASRISQKIHFDDYNPEQLLQIFCKFAKERNISVDELALSLMLSLFDKKTKEVDDQPFSNGRYARNCFDSVYQQHAINVKNKLPDIKQWEIGEDDVRPIYNEMLTLD